MSDWYNNIRAIQLQRDQHDGQLENFREVSPGEIVSEGGVTTRTDMGLSFTWVKLRGHDSSRVAALNMTSVTAAGTPVLVARDPKMPFPWQIIGPDPAQVRTDMVLSVGQYGVAIHGSNHQTADEADPGVDPVFVFQPMLYILKTVGDGTTLTVTTYPYDYNKGDVSSYFPGADTDLTGSVPLAGLIRKTLLYLDRDTNILGIVDGTTVPDDSVTPIPLPLVPAGIAATKSAWVTLAGGQSTITTSTDIDDSRDFLNSGQDNTLPTPTGPGQVLMTDENSAPIWADPVTAHPDDGGGWLTNQDGDLIIVG